MTARDHHRLRSAVLAGVIAALVATAGAQEGPDPAELKSMYDDAVAQLKTAQDRRAELAAENQQLQESVKQLETQLAATTQQVAVLQANEAVFAEKTYFLRSQYAAFQAFLQRHPELLAKWRTFLGAFTVPVPPVDGDDVWPLIRRSQPVE